MKDYFCCPECGSKKLSVIKDDKPFSLTKAICWSWLWGIFGILFAFLSGQTDLTVSTWICHNCKYKFQAPDEAQLALEKNKKAANVFITVYESICIIFVLIAFCISMLTSSLTSVLFSTNFAIINILFWVILGILTILFIIAIYEIIRYFVNKYYMRRIDIHIKNRRDMEAYISYDNSGFGPFQ